MIVQTALANWLAREVGEEQAEEIAHPQKCVLVPLDADIALEAADLRRQFKLAMMPLFMPQHWGYEEPIWSTGHVATNA